MEALTGQELVNKLRALVDSAKQRVWIASPYIGSLSSVERILGSNWENVDVRLLTDRESGWLTRNTLEKFAAHRPVRSLRGLHAKLYIVDDSVLLTSANLTEYAFTRRHEIGVVLTGDDAATLVDRYQSFWDEFDQIVDPSQIQPNPKSGGRDEPDAGPLPRLFTLPPRPLQHGVGAFADYDHFLDVYRSFAHLYLACGPPDRPLEPLYLETDKFLNFLFHHDAGLPSKEHKSKPHRPLSETEKASEIKKYRGRYRDAGFPGGDHLATAKVFQKYLTKSEIMRLTSDQIALIAGDLDWIPLAAKRFINGNHPDKIRASWFDLLHGQCDVKLRMNNCRAALFGFGKAAIQQTLGFYDPDRFPLRNENTNAGLRFLGYDIKVK